MKILLFSDSHGTREPMLRAVEKIRPDTVLHMGDGHGDLLALGEKFPDIMFYGVRGNCDPAKSAPDKRIIILEGKKIFMTHGHEYGVKLTLRRAADAAQKAGADFLLYGHTHVPRHEIRKGIHIINPGSIAYGRRTLGVLILDGGEMKYKCLPVEDI